MARISIFMLGWGAGIAAHCYFTVVFCIVMGICFYGMWKTIFLYCEDCPQLNIGLVFFPGNACGHLQARRRGKK
jgi:hypothetical protein